MSNAEEWASALWEEIQARQNADRENQRMVAMQRDIVAEKMPLKWEEVCAAFQLHCTAYNEQIKPARDLVFVRTRCHSFTVRPDALEEIVEGAFDPHNRLEKSLQIMQSEHSWSADGSLDM